MPETLLSVGVLAADLGRLAEELARLEEAGADWIHLDVMDGSFAPQLLGDIALFKAVRRLTSLPLDVHLMVQHPERHVAAFEGADWITVHAEAGPHLHRAVSEARRTGARAGVALNPGTHISGVVALADEVDLVLFVAVDPGFPAGGFVRGTLRKVAQLRRKLDDLGVGGVRIGIDGGVTLDNAAEIAASGADVVVSGSAVFKGAGPEENVQAFHTAFGRKG
ncbi:ribulose-phosphate 3-epimerase [Oceanithermus sp.]